MRSEGGTPGSTSACMIAFGLGAAEANAVFPSVVLNPFTRLRYFENTALWDPEVPERARSLLEGLYDEYAKKNSTANPNQPKRSTRPVQTPGKPSLFAIAVTTGLPAPDASDETGSELDLYFSNAYPCETPEGVLLWWKVCMRLLHASHDTIRLTLFIGGSCTSIPDTLPNRAGRSRHSWREHWRRTAFFFL